MRLKITVLIVLLLKSINIYADEWEPKHQKAAMNGCMQSLINGSMEGMVKKLKFDHNIILVKGSADYNQIKNELIEKGKPYCRCTYQYAQKYLTVKQMHKFTKLETNEFNKRQFAACKSELKF